MRYAIRREKVCSRKGSETMLYAVLDKNYDLIEFCGTMSELVKYTGKNKNAILSAISKSKSRGTRCRYVKIGKENE